MRIAPAFSTLGKRFWLYQVPKGRLNGRAIGRSLRDFKALGRHTPALKTLGYFRRSLRDSQTDSV